MNTIQQAVEAIRVGDRSQLNDLVAQDPAIRHARDENGVSLVMLACYHRRQDLAEVLLASDRPLDIFEAAAVGKVDRLTEILGQRPNLVADTSPDGFQPLHLAAFFAQPACVALILQHRADVNAVAKNSSAVRPIHSAVAGRCQQVVRELVEHGAELNTKQHGGWTPLHAAALHGDAELVKYFLAHGADPALTSDDGKTAAELATSKGHKQIVDILHSPEAV